MGAIDALVRLAPVDNIRVAVAIGDSLTDLLTEQPDLVTVTLMRLFDALNDWQARPSALLAFLIVAAQLVTPLPDAAEGGRTEGSRTDGSRAEVLWPGLLRHADEHADSRPLLVELWRIALNEPIHHGEATQVLRTWAARAGSDQPLREAFLRLVEAVARADARTAAIIRRCAAEWAQESGTPLAATASEISARLSGSPAGQKVL
jgi:hypothetical protein